MKKKFISASLSLLIIAFFSLATNIVFAAGSNVNGVVKGKIVDETGSGVNAVSITISNPASGLKRTVETSGNGRFQLQLPAGNYALTANKAGYQSIVVEKVLVNIGATTNLSLSTSTLMLEEVIILGTAATVIPIGNAESSLNISISEIEMLPVPRNIEAVALLAPGAVAADTAFGEDKILVSIGGASAAENVYYINGLNVTNFRNGLGGASVPFEFYDQFQIKNGGYSAEFGRSLGGVLNAVTKRGTNEFHYGLVSYFAPKGLRSTSPDSLRNDGVLYDLNSENERSGYTTDVYASGPIIKDRLFFYALYEARNRSEEFTSRGAPSDFNDREIDNNFWGANLLWNITDSHSLSYTTFTDERERINQQHAYDPDTRTVGELTGTSTEFRGGTNHIFRYDGQLTDNLVVSALYGLNRYDLTSTATTDATCPYVVDTSDGNAIPGNTSLFPGCEASARIDLGGDERKAYRLDVEWYLGTHNIRFGVDNETNTSNAQSTYSGTDFRTTGGGVYYRYFTWDVGETLPNGAIVPDANGDGSVVQGIRYRLSEVGGAFETTSVAWYVEDTWDVTDALTLSAGIRNETFENLNANGDVFIKIKDQWGPRFGFSWNPGGTDSTSRVYATWGRYHIPVASNTNVRLSGAELGTVQYFVFDGQFDPVTVAPINIDGEGIPTSEELGDILVFANGVTPDSSQLTDSTIKPMYHDEWILGYERFLGDDWLAGVKYVHRNLASGIDDVLIDNAVDALGYAHTGDAGGYVMTNPGTDITIEYDRFDTGVLETTTFPAELLGYPTAQRKYDAVELFVEKRFSNRWGMRATYVWSHNKGNTEGYVKSDIGQDDAGITQDFDQPQLMDGAYGDLPNDRRHAFKAYGSLQLTDQFLIGVSSLLQSGRPLNMFGIDHPDGLPIYGDTFYVTSPTTGELQFIPRGTAGRTDWTVQIDFSAIYSLDWGDRAEIQFRAEVFNVLNAKSVQEQYEFAEISIGTPDPRLHVAQSYQTPRYFRLGASIRF